MKNHTLYFSKPQQVDIVEESIPVPKKDEVLIRNIISGISAGTEMLFYNGLMPTELSADAAIPSLQQQMNYPFKYGYCSVGEVIDAGDKKLKHILNRKAFIFNPHETFFSVKEDQLLLLPDDISPLDAIFIPNMETAINLILDSAPLIGENVLVLGLGIVGLLTTALLQQFPLTTLIGMDLHPKRRNLCLELGAKMAFDPTSADLDSILKNYLYEQKQNRIDLVYELTGNPQALNSAISFACYEGRIVLGSWYGRKPSNIDLGGKFHRNRIKLITSQVSTLASELQGRWDKNRRFDITFNMLRKIKPAQFITHKFDITKAADAYQLLQLNPQEALQVALTYEEKPCTA